MVVRAASLKPYVSFVRSSSVYSGRQHFFQIWSKAAKRQNILTCRTAIQFDYRRHFSVILTQFLTVQLMWNDISPELWPNNKIFGENNPANDRPPYIILTCWGLPLHSGGKLGRLSLTLVVQSWRDVGQAATCHILVISSEIWLNLIFKEVVKNRIIFVQPNWWVGGMNLKRENRKESLKNNPLELKRKSGWLGDVCCTLPNWGIASPLARESTCWPG